MKCIKGTEAYLKEFTKEMDGEKAKVLSFVTMIELQMEEKQDFSVCAKEVWDDMYERYGSYCNVFPYLEFLEKTWVYGKECKEWCRIGGYTQKLKGESIESDIIISKHAKKRMHERCGLNRKAQERVARIAYTKGIPVEETKGGMHKFLSNRIRQTEDKEIAILRVYGDKLYVFKKVDNGNLLVTVLHVPSQAKDFSIKEA